MDYSIEKLKGTNTINNPFILRRINPITWRKYLIRSFSATLYDRLTWRRKLPPQRIEPGTLVVRTRCTRTVAPSIVPGPGGAERCTSEVQGALRGVPLRYDWTGRNTGLLLVTGRVLNPRPLVRMFTSRVFSPRPLVRMFTNRVLSPRPLAGPSSSPVSAISSLTPARLPRGDELTTLVPALVLLSSDGVAPCGLARYFPR
ncbi:unnamed protein product [Timema podura]|uniref:Uncharacterized protein n=1 Tax=Timema podura TaxID=61482 RepID=A0ABN7PBB1_TIMPD|nr:unnamed protein product [Timema podura]